MLDLVRDSVQVVAEHALVLVLVLVLVLALALVLADVLVVVAAVGAGAAQRSVLLAHVELLLLVNIKERGIKYEKFYGFFIKR